jgi:hypothetical protein
MRTSGKMIERFKPLGRKGGRLEIGFFQTFYHGYVWCTELIKRPYFMKKLFTIPAHMFCEHAAKAQVTRIHVTNTAGLSNPIFAYTGSDAFPLECSDTCSN